MLSRALARGNHAPQGGAIGLEVQSIAGITRGLAVLHQDIVAALDGDAVGGSISLLRPIVVGAHVAQRPVSAGTDATVHAHQIVVVGCRCSRRWT